MRPIILFCALTMSFASHAKEPQFLYALNAQPLTIAADNVQLKGFRFLNSNGQANTGKPILFTHGLHSNLHEFEHLVREKMAEGYDCYAFNFRGHGNGGEKSTVVSYNEGDYSFEKMAAVDFPEMVKTIRTLNGQKLFVIGHSMGGMVPRASIAKGLIDQNKLAALILLGSPPHFRNSSPLLPDLLVGQVRARLDKGSGQDSYNLVKALQDLGAPLDMLNLANPAYWLLKFGLDAHVSILEEGIEFFGLNEISWNTRAVTRDIPKDILRSFAEYQTNYPYEDVNLTVPALYIVGGNDLLVNSGDVLESAKVQPHSAGRWFITLHGVGHLSLIAPEAITDYRKPLQQFMDSPESLGPANETHVRKHEGLCTRLLLGV